MAQILKFPAPPSKLGFKRVRRRTKTADHPNQLHLFPQPAAQILDFASGLSCFEHALLLDERGDARAAEFYARAIAEGDCVADAHCNLGILASQKGNTAQAFDCFTAALKHDPRHCEAHYNLGNLYFEVEDFRLAQAHYEMALAVEPSFANVYFNLALVHSVRNDVAGAIAALTKYRQLVPEEEARHADDLLETLRKSAAQAKA